jgi:radical SAM superfamily enzyme YgiQ (UPF0313 family)
MLETGRCVDLECLECGPDLGVASLLGSLGRNQIKTHFVAGSTRYLKDVLMTDSDELIEILTQGKIKAPDCLEANVNMLRNLIHDHGEGWFKEHLGDVYGTLRSRGIGDYLSIPRLRYSKDVADCILSIYGSAIMQKAGGELSIVRRLFEEIARSKPDVVGFSIKAQFGVLSDPLFVAASQRVKAELGVPIVVGGQFTSGQPVEMLHSSLTLSMRNIDYLVRGNADLSLPQLVRVVEAGNTPKEVPNVSFHEDGRIVSNRVETIRDLDALPIPDFSQFDLDAYAPVRILPMLTARGCPWRECAFCSHYRNYGDLYVSHSIDRVIETIKEYREKYRTHFIVLNDETLPSSRAREISSSLVREGVDDVYINTYGRMDAGYTKEVLSLMYKAGFRVIFWGLESGCQRTLDSMNKGIRTEIMSRILRDSWEAGMANFCFVMLGFPGEERKDAIETFTFLKKHRDYVDLIAPNVFSLSETSPIGRDPGRWGVVIDDSKYGYHVERGLQPYEVEGLASEMYKQVQSMVSDRFMEWWRWGVLPDPYWRNLLFIFHSKSLLDCGHVAGIIHERGNWPSLFPVFTGRLRDWNSKKIATSALWGETPSDGIVLDDLGHAFCSLADGNNSLDGILESLKEARPFEGEDNLAAHALELIKRLMGNRLVVFFSNGFSDGMSSGTKLMPPP